MCQSPLQLPKQVLNVMRVFVCCRNERARWISALGQNNNNNKNQDRSSEYTRYPSKDPPLSLWRHLVAIKDITLKCL